MDDQLPLTFTDDRPEGTELPVRLPLRTPTEGGRPFDDDSFFFEPWWPGTHAYLRRDGRRLELHVEHLADPLAFFPELAADLRDIGADGFIAEGTLLALDPDGRPDADLLRERLRGADVVGEGAFVAADLVYLEGTSLAGRPFAERRHILHGTVADSDHRVVSRGLPGEGVTLARAAASLGLGAVSARRLDSRWKAGAAGDAWLRLAVSEPQAPQTRPLMVLLETLPLDD